jgi:hypothetical protein
MVNPFLALVILAKEYKMKFFQNVIWAFFVFYGLTIVKNTENSDVSRYSKWFESFAMAQDVDWSTFFDESEKLDYFRPLSFQFVAIFSDSSVAYFAFIGLIFGYYYSRILGFVFENIN